MVAGPAADRSGSSALVRLGGASIVVALAIHIVANDFIKVMPPDVMSAAQLRDYLIEQDGNWAVVHGFPRCQDSCRLS